MSRSAAPPAEIGEFLAFLAKERNDSPHTVKAYARDVAEFAAFCGRYYGGPWSWAGVDRLAIRGFLGESIREFYARWPVDRLLEAWVDAGVTNVRAQRLSVGGGIVIWGVRA